MPRKAPKMTDLVIDETSGVDHPAHLHEGWLVIKTSDADQSKEDSVSETVEEQKADEQDKGYGMEYQEKDMAEELAMAAAKISELEARIAELEAMVEEPEVEVEIEGEDMMEESVVALAKAASDDVRKALVDMAKAKADAETALMKEREDRADEAATLKARDTFKHLTLDPAKVGPALRRLAAIDAELAKSVEDALVSADAQNESADIFTEVGKGFTQKGDAIERMTSLAKAAVAEGKAATIEQALASVAMENPALYNDYLIEKGA